MKAIMTLVVLTITGAASIASAQSVKWTRYTIPQTGTSVDFPSSIFTKEVGSPDGYGQRFQSEDGRSNLTVQAAPNLSHDSPAAFLAKKNPPSQMQYKRVTPRFFAVSSYKENKVWYDRCNFSRRLINCLLISYPAEEERAWDDVVTRMSLSLTPR